MSSERVKEKKKKRKRKRRKKEKKLISGSRIRRTWIAILVGYKSAVFIYSCTVCPRVKLCVWRVTKCQSKWSFVHRIHTKTTHDWTIRFWITNFSVFFMVKYPKISKINTKKHEQKTLEFCGKFSQKIEAKIIMFWCGIRKRCLGRNVAIFSL